MHGNFQPCQGPTKQFITHGSLKPHGWLIIEADLLTKSKINISHDNNPLFYLPHEQQWMLIVNSQQLAKHPKIVLHKVLNSTLAKQYWHCKMPHLSPSLLELHVITLEHTMSEATPPNNEGGSPSISLDNLHMDAIWFATASDLLYIAPDARQSRRTSSISSVVLLPMQDMDK